MSNWHGAEGRCIEYCKNLSDEDWWNICDCWEAERVLGHEYLPPPKDGPQVDTDVEPIFE